MSGTLYQLYSKNGLVLGQWRDKSAAIYAYRHWSQAWTLFADDDVIMSKW